MTLPLFLAQDSHSLQPHAPVGAVQLRRRGPLQRIASVANVPKEKGVDIPEKSLKNDLFGDIWWNFESFEV